MTIEKIKNAYNERYPYLPVTDEGVEWFLNNFPIFRGCEDLVYTANMMYHFFTEINK